MNRQNKTTSGQIENKKELEIESNANKALQYRQHVYILASFCLFRQRYVIIQIAEHGPWTLKNFVGIELLKGYATLRHYSMQGHSQPRRGEATGAKFDCFVYVEL